MSRPNNKNRIFWYPINLSLKRLRNLVRIYHQSRTLTKSQASTPTATLMTTLTSVMSTRTQLQAVGCAWPKNSRSRIHSKCKKWQTSLLLRAPGALGNLEKDSPMNLRPQASLIPRSSTRSNHRRKSDPLTVRLCRNNFHSWSWR